MYFDSDKIKYTKGSLFITNPDGSTVELDGGNISLTVTQDSTTKLSDYAIANGNTATISVHSFTDDIREIKERLDKLEQVYQDDLTYFKRVL